MSTTAVTSHTIFLSLLTVLILTYTGTTNADATEFEDYIGVLNCVKTVAQKLRVLEAVWTEIQFEDAFNVSRAATLHKTIYDQLKQPTELEFSGDEQREIDGLYQQVRNVIIEINGQKLAQAISVVDIRNFQTPESDNGFDYDPVITSKIYETAIDLVYGTKSPTEIATFLERNVLVPGPNDIDAELYLYWKELGRGDSDDNALLLLGYYLQAVKNFNLGYSKERARRIDKTIATFPSTLQTLYFKQNVCLLNAAYEEYLYEPFDILLDSNRSYVFTWTEPHSVGGNGVWNFQFNVGYSDADVITISANLLNVYKQQYLYRDSDRDNQVLAWIPEDPKPENTSWKIKLNENKISLSQDDYVLCAVPDLHDSSRRFVRAIEYSSGDLPATCEWIVDECPPAAT